MTDPTLEEQVATAVSEDLAAEFLPIIRRNFDKAYIPEPMSGCWLWEKYAMRTPGGAEYGVIGFTNGGHHRTLLAHRVSYMLHKGPTHGDLILHHCDNASCVNPDHLYPGTSQDNSDDKMRRGRDRKRPKRGEENSGAKLTLANVLAIRAAYTGRGGITQQKLGDQYGVTQSHIKDVISGKRWGHIK